MKNAKPVTGETVISKAVTSETASSGSAAIETLPANPVATPPPGGWPPAETPPPVTAPVNPKDPQAKALLEAKAKVAAAGEALQTGLALARKTLGHALRVMIANQFPENDGGRRIAENAFEEVKNIQEGKGTRAELAQAVTSLNHAVNHIANHSLKFPGDLDALRDGYRGVALALEQYDAVNLPE